MSAATVTSNAESSKIAHSPDCRVYERYPSDLSTQCQPLAARGENDMMWPANVRDISAGGVGLLLQRRFEPRTGLAIELPDTDGSAYTVFVRVVHATAKPGGQWLLGCQFVSPLPDERLKALLEISQKRSQPASAEVAPPAVNGAANPLVIPSVRFHAKLPDGRVLSRCITRLHITGIWPLVAGAIVKVWIGKEKKNGARVPMRVRSCRLEGIQWLVDCEFVGVPPTELVRWLDNRQPRRTATNPG